MSRETTVLHAKGDNFSPAKGDNCFTHQGRLLYLPREKTVLPVVHLVSGVNLQETWVVGGSDLDRGRLGSGRGILMVGDL